VVFGVLGLSCVSLSVYSVLHYHFVIDKDDRFHRIIIGMYAPEVIAELQEIPRNQWPPPAEVMRSWGPSAFTPASLMWAGIGLLISWLVLVATVSIAVACALVLRTKETDLPPPPKTNGLFISYRRKDTQDIAGRIRDRLVARFGPDKVFFDVESIEGGEKFPSRIEENVARCDVVLAIIGELWLNIADKTGRRRLDDEADWVRREIALALGKKRVIPVLVNGAQMPRRQQLPSPIQELADCNPLPARSGRDFHPDVAKLIDTVEDAIRKRATHQDTKQEPS
jgi:hypothetical protein